MYVMFSDNILHELEQTEAALAHFQRSFAGGKPDRNVFRRLREAAQWIRRKPSPDDAAIEAEATPYPTDSTRP
jgi:hypothetical protein